MKVTEDDFIGQKEDKIFGEKVKIIEGWNLVLLYFSYNLRLVLILVRRVEFLSELKRGFLIFVSRLARSIGGGFF